MLTYLHAAGFVAHSSGITAGDLLLPCTLGLCVVAFLWLRRQF